MLYNHKAPNHRQATIDKIKNIPTGKTAANMDATWTYQGNYKRLASEPMVLPNGKYHTGLAPTVTCHCWSELTHPVADRNLTVRECARLQSFPDTYEFKGERIGFHGAGLLYQYFQVGNAVSVLLAKAIGESCLDLLVDCEVGFSKSRPRFALPKQSEPKPTVEMPEPEQYPLFEARLVRKDRYWVLEDL